MTPSAVGIDGTVYGMSMGNKIVALDGATGQKIWEFQMGSAIISTPIVGLESAVYVASGDGKVSAWDANTGTNKWVSPVANLSTSPVLGSDGTLYVGCTDGKVITLDSRSGLKTGEFIVGRAIVASPTLGPDGTLYVASTNGSLYAFQSPSVGGLARSSWPTYRGDAQNTGRVQVVPVTLRFLSCQFSTNGFHLQIQGSSGQSCFLDATSDFQTWTLPGPFTNTTERIQYLDPESIRLPQRFYRLHGR